MLIVVVTVFATLWLPYRSLLVYNSFAETSYMELWYLMFCKTMIYANSAINPILYNALSVKFRRAFKKMLSCESCQRESSQRRSYGVTGQFTSVQVSQTEMRHNPTIVTTCTLKTTSCKVEQLQHNV